MPNHTVQLSEKEPEIIKYRKNGKWYKYKGSLPKTVEAVEISEYITLAQFNELYPDRKLKSFPIERKQ